MSQKILELKGEHWLRGRSIQQSYPVGGVLKSGVYDPFERMGHVQPPLQSIRRGTDEIVTTINQIVPYENGGTPLAYLFSDRNASDKGVYQINTSTGVVTDVSSTFHTNLAGGATAEVQGAVMFKGAIIYEQDGTIRRNTKAGASDQNVGSLANGSVFYKRKGVATQTFLYWPDSYKISTINTSYALTNSAFTLPDSFRIVSLEFDGDNVVIICDENAVGSAGGSPSSDVVVRCQVKFWNRTTADPIRTWIIPDEPYLVGSAQLDGLTYIFGANGIWYCSLIQPPKLLVNYKNTNSGILARPSSPYQITVANGSIMWTSNIATGTSGFSTAVHAYGSPLPGGKKIFYTPYKVHASTFHETALAYCGNTFLAATSSNRVYQLNTGSTRDGLSIQNATITLDKPYTYEGMVVNLLAPLASGESVTVSAHAEDGATTIDNGSTMSYTASQNRKHLWFKREAGTTPVFRDIVLTITTTGTAIISSVEVFGEPVDEKRIF